MSLFVNTLAAAAACTVFATSVLAQSAVVPIDNEPSSGQNVPGGFRDHASWIGRSVLCQDPIMWRPSRRPRTEASASAIGRREKGELTNRGVTEGYVSLRMCPIRT
jgi:hypothetical protein